jgi:hypothetical protein
MCCACHPETEHQRYKRDHRHRFLLKVLRQPIANQNTKHCAKSDSDNIDFPIGKIMLRETPATDRLAGALSQQHLAL